jgi:hypothetical protein
MYATIQCIRCIESSNLHRHFATGNMGWRIFCGELILFAPAFLLSKLRDVHKRGISPKPTKYISVFFFAYSLGTLVYQQAFVVALVYLCLRFSLLPQCRRECIRLRPCYNLDVLVCYYPNIRRWSSRVTTGCSYRMLAPRAHTVHR